MLDVRSPCHRTPVRVAYVLPVPERDRTVEAEHVERLVPGVELHAQVPLVHAEDLGVDVVDGYVEGERAVIPRRVVEIEVGRDPPVEGNIARPDLEREGSARSSGSSAPRR